MSCDFVVLICWLVNVNIVYMCFLCLYVIYRIGRCVVGEEYVIVFKKYFIDK